jgi:hypothetical protein
MKNSKDLYSEWETWNSTAIDCANNLMAGFEEAEDRIVELEDLILRMLPLLESDDQESFRTDAGL